MPLRANVHAQLVRMVIPRSAATRNLLFLLFATRSPRAMLARATRYSTRSCPTSRGNFQLAYFRWVGANNDPDAFEFFFSSKRFPPNGANRGHYRSTKMDALTDQIRMEMNREKRKELCSQAQKLFAEDLPYIPLWFTDVVSVHSHAIGEPAISRTGDYDFLSTLRPTQ